MFILVHKLLGQATTETPIHLFQLDPNSGPPQVIHDFTKDFIDKVIGPVSHTRYNFNSSHTEFFNLENFHSSFFPEGKCSLVADNPLNSEMTSKWILKNSSGTTVEEYVFFNVDPSWITEVYAGNSDNPTEVFLKQGLQSCEFFSPPGIAKTTLSVSALLGGSSP